MENKRASKSFRDLIVWQKAHMMVLDVYNITKAFPNGEIYTLTSQVRRSSISIAANIAEAFKKKSSAEKLRLLNIAQGSLSETEYYFILAADLQYAEMSELQNKADEVGRILEAYMSSIRRTNSNR